MPNAGWWEALWPDPADVLTKVGIRPGMDVIDLCSGDGWFTLQIAKRARLVVAVDIDPVLLEVIRHRLREANISNCEFIAGDAYDAARELDAAAERPGARPRAPEHRDIRTTGLRDRSGDRCFADTWIGYPPRRGIRCSDGDQPLAGTLRRARRMALDYMFLVVLQLIYVIDPPGRSLGVDALAWRREGTARQTSPVLSLVA